MEYGREQILAELEAEISSMKMKLNRVEEMVAKLKISDATSSSVDVPEVVDTNFNSPLDLSQSYTEPSPADMNVAEQSHTEISTEYNTHAGSAVEQSYTKSQADIVTVDDSSAEFDGSHADELEAIKLAGKPFDESDSDDSDDEIAESSPVFSTSHISEPETSESEMSEPVMFEPESSEPGTSESEASKTEILELKASEHEMSEPVMFEPESSEPETLEEVWNMQAEEEEENVGTEEGADDGNVISRIGPKFWLTDIAGIPVKDLRSAISMNDKILFINTLFNEDPVLYQDVVRRINGMEKFSDAVDYLIPNFQNWNLDSDVVYRFMMAVRRRLK